MPTPIVTMNFFDDPLQHPWHRELTTFCAKNPNCEGFRPVVGRWIIEVNKKIANTQKAHEAEIRKMKENHRREIDRINWIDMVIGMVVGVAIGGVLK